MSDSTKEETAKKCGQLTADGGAVGDRVVGDCVVGDCVVGKNVRHAKARKPQSNVGSLPLLVELSATSSLETAS